MIERNIKNFYSKTKFCQRIEDEVGCDFHLTIRPPLIEIQIGVLIFRKSSLGNLKLNKYMSLIQIFPLRQLVKIAFV